MKTISFKNFIKLILVFVSFILTKSALSQTIELSESAFHCPNIVHPISVSINDNEEKCNYTWTVSNGLIINNNSTTYQTRDNIIFLKWIDEAKLGKIELTILNCDDTLIRDTFVTKEYPVLSLNGITPDKINGNNGVVFGVQQENYRINRMTYNFDNQTFSVDNNVYNYRWLLPKGWSSSGIISTGTNEYSTYEPNINVETDTLSSGTIQVWGVNECYGTANSNKQILNITREFEAFEINVATENEYLQGDLAPFNFYVPDWDYATYQWTLPEGWNFQGSSNIASIMAIPHGCNGGIITCKVTVPATGDYIIKTHAIRNFAPYPDNKVPTITGDDYLCSLSDYRIENLPQRTSYINWQTTGYASIVSGQNEAIVYLNPVQSGNAQINTTISVAGCPSFELEPKSIWVGKPWLVANQPLAYYSSGWYNEVCYSNNYTVEMDLNGASNATWSRIAAYPSNTSWHQVGNDLKFYFWAVNQSAVFRVTSSNACGSVVYDYGFKSKSCGTNPCNPLPATISPNPVSTESTIIINIPAPCDELVMKSKSKNKDNELHGFVKIYNTNGQIMEYKEFTYPAEDLSFNVSALSTGIYFVEIFDGIETTKQPLLIKR